jgi:hypothetical protein
LVTLLRDPKKSSASKLPGQARGINPMEDKAASSGEDPGICLGRFVPVGAGGEDRFELKRVSRWKIPSRIFKC